MKFINLPFPQLIQISPSALELAIIFLYGVKSFTSPFHHTPKCKTVLNIYVSSII